MNGGQSVYLMFPASANVQVSLGDKGGETHTNPIKELCKRTGFPRPPKAMEEELINAKNSEGNPYNLIALPMADEIIFDGERLPASYANFLIVNGAVLMPTYSQPDNDKMAIDAISKAFPGYEVVGIDCVALIKQHGSLHCITMQYPEGVL